MYLRASEYVSRYDWTRDDDGHILDNPNPLFKSIVENFEMENVIDSIGHAGISIDFPMGYWRKSNQIHNWFVDECGSGVDECQIMFVPRAKLEELKSLCEQVLAEHHLADVLLPTSSGFFFGSIDYDEFYFADLKNTIEIIDRCLATKFDYFEYQASW